MTGRRDDYGRDMSLVRWRCLAAGRRPASGHHSFMRRALGCGGFTSRYFRPASTSA
jgi:hypothetical protein